MDLVNVYVDNGEPYFLTRYDTLHYSNNTFNFAYFSTIFKGVKDYHMTDFNKFDSRFVTTHLSTIRFKDAEFFLYSQVAAIFVAYLGVVD